MKEVKLGHNGTFYMDDTADGAASRFVYRYLYIEDADGLGSELDIEYSLLSMRGTDLITGDRIVKNIYVGNRRVNEKDMLCLIIEAEDTETGEPYFTALDMKMGYLDKVRKEFLEKNKNFFADEEKTK